MLRIRSNMTRVCGDDSDEDHNLFNAFFLFAPGASFAVLFTALVVLVVALPVILASAVPKGDG